MSKVIYIEYTEEVGEVQGAFDENGDLIHIWSMNDANWRNEYLDPILEHFDIEVRSGVYVDKLIAEAKALWGDWESEYEDD